MSKALQLDESRDYLIKAPLPEQTETYTVIPHKMVIDTVTELLKEKEFAILKENYKYSMNAAVAYGVYMLAPGDDPDVGMIFAWCNSYNKQVRFRCAIGAFVKSNDAFIISDKYDTSYARKHTGRADEEVKEVVQAQLKHAFEYYRQIVDDKNVMKGITIDKDRFAHLIGDMYILQKMISSEQLNIIVREFWKPSFQYENVDPTKEGVYNLWVIYNHILQGLMKCHPAKWMAQQRAVHSYICATFGINMNQEAIDITDDITELEQKVIADVKKLEHDEAQEVSKEPVRSYSAEEEEEVEKTEPTDNQEEYVEKDHRMGFAGEEEVPSDLDAEEDEDWEKLQKAGALKEVTPEKEEGKTEDMENINGKDMKVKVNLPKTEKSENGKTVTGDIDGRIFKTMGKLKELFPDFKVGDTLNVKGIDYVIGDPTIQHTMPGHWLIPVVDSVDNSAEIPDDNPVVEAAPVEEVHPVEKEEIPDVIPVEDSAEAEVLEEEKEEVLEEEEVFEMEVVEEGEENFEELEEAPVVEEEEPVEAAAEVVEEKPEVKEEEPKATLPPKQKIGSSPMEFGFPTAAATEVKEAEATVEAVEEAVESIPEAAETEEELIEDTVPQTGPNVIINKVSEDDYIAGVDPAIEEPSETVTTKMEPAQMVAQEEIEITKHDRTEEETDDVKAVIAKELEILYGKKREFTYKETNDQFNITLDSEETISLTKGYIERKVLEHKGQTL